MQVNRYKSNLVKQDYLDHQIKNYIYIFLRVKVKYM